MNLVDRSMDKIDHSVQGLRSLINDQREKKKKRINTISIPSYKSFMFWPATSVRHCHSEFEADHSRR